MSGPGIDLVADDPGQARALLVDAYEQLDVAEQAKVKATTIAPLRKRVEAGLDRLYGVVPVATATRFTFTPAEGADPIDLRALVRGPDGAPYVLDRSTRSVYRIDLKNKKATLVTRFGQKANGATVASPRFIGLGATSDLLILDSKNVLWRWRPADSTGKGTLVRINVKGSTQWGDDIRGFGTYLRDKDRNLYNLYVVDPSEQQIVAYSPSADGGGFPGDGSPWLATARDVSAMNSIYIDGDLFAARTGSWSASSRARATAGTRRPLATRSCGRRRCTRRWPAASARTGGPAGSTPTTSRTPGSSRSTRRTARTRPSTGSPAAIPAGTTCAASTSSRASTRRRRNSCGSARTASTSPPWRRSPTRRRRRRPRPPPPAARPRPASRPPPPDPGSRSPVIPLRDANPTRRTPVVTIGLVAACLIAFAWELGLQVSGGDEALDAFITAWGVVPADLTAAWAPPGS